MADRPRVIAELHAVVLGDRGDDDPFPRPHSDTVSSRIPVRSMSTSVTATPAGRSSARRASIPAAAALPARQLVDDFAESGELPPCYCQLINRRGTFPSRRRPPPGDAQNVPEVPIKSFGPQARMSSRTSASDLEICSLTARGPSWSVGRYARTRS